MILNDLYNLCLSRANRIPNFVEGQKEDVDYDIDILINKYCYYLDINDEYWKDSYISALLIRYWHLIPYYFKKSPGVEIEEVVDWIFDGIHRACQYRNWLSDKFKNNRRGAEICINNAINSSRKRFYALSNRQKRSAFFFQNSILSIDSLERNEANKLLGFVDRHDYICEDIVNKLIELENYVGAIFIDLLVNSDGYKSSYELYTAIKNINCNYKNYFINRYEVSDINKLNKAFEKISSKTERSLTWFARNEMKKLKESSVIKNFL